MKSMSRLIVRVAASNSRASFGEFGYSLFCSN